MTEFSTKLIQLFRFTDTKTETGTMDHENFNGHLC